MVVGKPSEVLAETLTDTYIQVVCLELHLPLYDLCRSRNLTGEIFNRLLDEVLIQRCFASFDLTLDGCFRHVLEQQDLLHSLVQLLSLEWGISVHHVVCLEAIVDFRRLFLLPPGGVALLVFAVVLYISGFLFLCLFFGLVITCVLGYSLSGLDLLPALLFLLPLCFLFLPDPLSFLTVLLLLVLLRELLDLDLLLHGEGVWVTEVGEEHLDHELALLFLHLGHFDWFLHNLELILDLL